MYKLRENVVLEEVEGKGKCTVIDEQNEILIKLGQVENEVLHLLLKYDADKTLQLLKEEYEGDRIQQDVEEFISLLLEKEIIQ